MNTKWYKDPITLFGIGTLGFLFVEFGGAKALSNKVKDVFKRGNHVNYGTFNSVLGIIEESPEDLRVAASNRMGFEISPDVHALSYMIRSEGASEGLLRAHVAMNDLSSFKYADNLFELLTYSNDPKRRGLYGAQYSPPVPPNYPKANARRYATSQNPYSGDVEMALAAIQEREDGIDRANGAVKFIDKGSMGVQLGSRSFDEINNQWMSEGLEPFTLPEYGTDLVLYRRG